MIIHFLYHKALITTFNTTFFNYKITFLNSQHAHTQIEKVIFYLIYLGVNVSIAVVQQYIIPSVVNSLVPFAKMELGIASERLLKVSTKNLD